MPHLTVTPSTTTSTAADFGSQSFIPPAFQPAETAAVIAGSIYAGIAVGLGVADYHLFLSPSIASNVTWHEAAEFARSVNGHLPTEVEIELLERIDHEFGSGFHWFDDQCDDTGVAWSYDFKTGEDGYVHEGIRGNARFVQRVSLVQQIVERPVSAIAAIGAAFAGGIYAGIIRGVDGGPDQHLVLVEGEGVDLSWSAAGAWAESVGGSLPTRAEQALLFANLKDQFKSDWYWSGEQYGPSSSTAWLQGFLLGYQYDFHKSYEGRARAVRRLPI